MPDTLLAAPPTLPAPPTATPACRLMRLNVDGVAAGAIAIHLALTEHLPTHLPVEIELSCADWRITCSGRVIRERALPPDELEWIVEAHADDPPLRRTLLRLATLGDARHLRAKLWLLCSGGAGVSPALAAHV